MCLDGVPLVDLTDDAPVQQPKRRKIEVAEPEPPSLNASDYKDNAEVLTQLRRYIICCICQHNALDLASTKCGHLFCYNCISAALESRRECPTCRAKVNKNGYHRIDR